jgi:hypothetical protein
MIHSKKRLALVYLILAGIGLLFLAFSLSSMQLQPGRPLPGSITEESATAGSSSNFFADFIIFLRFLKIAILPVLLLFSIFLIVQLVKNVPFKDIAPFLIVFCFMVLALYLISRATFAFPTIGPIELSPVAIQTLKKYNTDPIGTPPQIIYWIMIGILLLGAVGLGIWLFRRSFFPSKKEYALAFEAKTALAAIRAGEELGSIILRCYQQMMTIVQEENGIEREESITPREFEAVLIEQGIPEESINQLTRLFEKVRYGGKEADAQDEQAAVSSLSAIQAAILANHRINL